MTHAVSGAPLVIEMAINGMTTRERNPHVPRRPDEVAAEALACFAGGAAIVHAHNDRIDLPLDEAIDCYAATWTPVLRERPDALWYPTQALAPTMAERTAHYGPLAQRAGLRIGMIDPGCVNVTWADDDGLPAPGLGPYVNTVEDIHVGFAQCRELGLGTSVSIYEPTWLNHTLAFARAGRLSDGSMVKLYFGGPNGYFARGAGVSFGLPPTVNGLGAYRDMLDTGPPLPWSVSVLGGDLLTTPVAELAVRAGGHLKLGLEDHSGDGTPTNLELLRAARELGERCGRPAATPAEAADILGLAPRETR
jgi:3-keto-5-aminohexanoate cleavage enzyme